MRRKKL